MNTQPLVRRTGIASINPATGQLLQRFEPYNERELEHRLALAESTFRDFRHSTFAERASMLNRAAELLEKEKVVLGRTMTLEMGKPIRASIQEVEKCAMACRYYAENGATFLANEPTQAKHGKSYLCYEPLGPVLAIMPWNFPFWQVFRFAVPTLMAGNVGLLKHASNVPQCALAIEDLLHRAGLPRGTFQTLLIGSQQVNQLIEDFRVRAVTLTGSVDAGAKVAAAAGGQIKKTVLELGGSDPFIVMPSANLDEVAAIAVQARTINNGQSCIEAKRFIVEKHVVDDFEKKFLHHMASLKVGDPLDEATDIGPLATEQVVADLQDQVNKTIAMGAKVLLGGKRLNQPGYFFAPTILSEIPSDSPASREELFGPVASIFRADNCNDAIRIANSTGFGLGASAWTQDADQQNEFVRGLEAGMVFINAMVASDPILPFGGIKRSGYGRELGQHGIREFVNIKTVLIQDRAEGFR
jgi:succinate-semialdehyde dehydrogenase/glutarate-semialdehyde dehydrogenase